MNRDDLIHRLRDPGRIWDVLVIGGGATGLGCAIESASRGYQTLLLEQNDFAKGTSSRSTKLIHGGVRYLRQGQWRLVKESLLERGFLLRNAPHLVKRQALVIPAYKWWERTYYGAGLKLYDQLAGSLKLGTSRRLSRDETLEHLPTLKPGGLLGGVLFNDARFDDARLAVILARTVADLGGVPLNYVKVVSFHKENRVVRGVVARDEETGEEYDITSRAVVNATGIFSDETRRMDGAEAPRMLTLSRGIHIVLPRRFLPSHSALLIPTTADGRVLFAIPWEGRILVGTTDTTCDAPSLEPHPTTEEIRFVLDQVSPYMSEAPSDRDVLSAFAGIRPLIAHENDRATPALSRDHRLLVSESGLVSITGGKWTTYRRMGEDTIDKVMEASGLPAAESTTATLKLHGWDNSPAHEADGLTGRYGADLRDVEGLLNEDPHWRKPLHQNLPYLQGEIVWAVRHEMARTVEDVLARRTRALTVDARAATEVAGGVASVMARELGKGAAWAERQMDSFAETARGYLVGLG